MQWGESQKAGVMTMDERYWIALNGSSCAISPLPMRNPMATPTPYQLIGFPTYEEAQRAQRICLEAPMGEVNKFLAALTPDVKSGRIRVIEHAHPQPPTRCPTMWTEDTDMHQAIQQAFIKMTSN
jgi:hypothetical protein